MNHNMWHSSVSIPFDLALPPTPSPPSTDEDKSTSYGYYAGVINIPPPTFHLPSNLLNDSKEEEEIERERERQREREGRGKQMIFY